QAYIKPTFYLELLGDALSVTPGTPLSLKVRARRYAGGAPSNTAYEVFLYRTLLETPTWIDDAGLGGQGSTLTYGGPSTFEGALSIPTRLYSSVEGRANAADFSGDDPWATAARFDATGETTVSVQVPALAPGEEALSYKYTLTVRAQDSDKAVATASKTFFLAPSDVQGQVSVNAKVVLKDAPAMLSVRALTLGGKPAAEITGDVSFSRLDAQGGAHTLHREAFRTDAQGIWRTALPTDALGGVTAQVTLKDAAGRPWQGQASTLVIGTGGEAAARVPALEATALADTVEPGEEATLVALFPEKWGPGGGTAGPVWITLAGATLYDTQVVQVRGQTLVHRFPVERRFGSAVYASIAYPTGTGRWDERTVPFRVVPSER
ncbi:MAG TPA: alpha-2-macroglobulin, partial [Myxococcota bacterium]|nr:alpha-2-macroglobulin [Myxococcota bacterium]